MTPDIPNGATVQENQTVQSLVDETIADSLCGMRDDPWHVMRDWNQGVLEIIYNEPGSHISYTVALYDLDDGTYVT